MMKRRLREGVEFFRFLRESAATIGRLLEPASRFFRWRGGPIRIGWNSTAATSVVTSDRLSSLPMLDVPG